MPRPKKSKEEIEAMRERILDATVAILKEEGPGALSIRAIAERVGVSHMVLYTYFENRATLMAAMRQRQRSRMEARQSKMLQRAETGDVCEVVRDALVGYTRMAEKWPRVYQFLWIEPVTESDCLPDQSRRMEDHLNHLARLIELGIERGVFVELAVDSPAFVRREPRGEEQGVTGVQPKKTPLGGFGYMVRPFTEARFGKHMRLFPAGDSPTPQRPFTFRPDAKDVDLVWHYVAFDMELRSKRTPDQLRDLAERTRALIDEIERASEYPPRESSLCEWCDYQSLCPLFSHRFKAERFGSVDYEADDGQALVNSFASLDAQKHELAARIKGIESEQDRIKEAAVGLAEKEGVKRLFGDDHVLNLKDDLKVRYPKKGELRRPDFELSMKEIGLWDSVSDVSWSQLKALAERESWASEGRLPAQLKDLMEVRRTKQVRLARRKDRIRERED